MKTKDKIISNAIKLFNTQGVSNVRLQDIAKESNISAGNLNYHYHLKRDLIIAVLAYMSQSFRDMKVNNVKRLEQGDYTAVIKSFLNFQIKHRFFYRDILEISRFTDDAAALFEYQMNEVLNFTRTGMQLAVEKGLIQPEPHEGHYTYFAKSLWAILSSWLVEREILGNHKVNIDKVMTAIWECHYPYLTDVGQELYLTMKNELTDMIESDAML